MAARLNPSHDERTRAKIKVSQLLNLLQSNALTGTPMLDAIRQRSAEICLRKALPDLSATEITGQVATYVARLPSPAVDVTAWTKSLDTVSTPLAQPMISVDNQACSTDVPSGGKTETDSE